MSTLPMAGPAAAPPPSAVRRALLGQAPAFKVVAGYSLIVSLMVLVPTWFMLEVYDRVVNSRNERTLWMLFVIVVAAYVMMELLELVRKSS